MLNTTTIRTNISFIVSCLFCSKSLKENFSIAMYNDSPPLMTAVVVYRNAKNMKIIKYFLLFCPTQLLIKGQ